jgi:SAM-dependent methyltransferase
VTDFDRYASGYREAVERSIAFARTDLDFFTRAKARELLSSAARRVGEPRSLSFVDVGCGPGETDRFLQGQVGRLTGVDVVPALAEAARESNPWVEYEIIDDDRELPFAAATFDVSFAICVLHHVPRGRRAELVREMGRVTRPGGLVAIFEHNPWNPLTRRAVAGCEFDADASLLTRRETVRLLRDAFTEIEGAYILFFTRDSRPLRWIEDRLRPIALGAQYVVTARPA